MAVDFSGAQYARWVLRKSVFHKLDYGTLGGSLTGDGAREEDVGCGMRQVLRAEQLGLHSKAAARP
jgi:hypothetical protein